MFLSQTVLTLTLSTSRDLHELQNVLFGPRRDQTCIQGFQQSETKTNLLSYRD